MKMARSHHGLPAASSPMLMEPSYSWFSLLVGHCLRPGKRFIGRYYAWHNARTGPFNSLCPLPFDDGGAATGAAQVQGQRIVRRENDPTRDLTPKGIVAAVRKLEAAGVPIDNEYIVLNQWR